MSPLGLWFDKAHEITLCYEPGVQDTPRIAFPPLRQRGHRDLRAEVFWERVLPLLGVTPVPVSMEETPRPANPLLVLDFAAFLRDNTIGSC